MAFLSRGQMAEHLDKERIVVHRQFGFMKGRPCVASLLSIYSPGKQNTGKVEKGRLHIL